MIILPFIGKKKTKYFDCFILFYFSCCERGYVELVELLLHYGADGRVHPVTFYSPLYIAVHAGHTRVVEILLKVGFVLWQTVWFLCLEQFWKRKLKFGLSF